MDGVVAPVPKPATNLLFVPTEVPAAFAIPLATAMRAAVNRLDADVPPTTVQEPFADICQPELGSAFALVSGTPRPTAPLGITPSCQLGIGTVGSNPPPPPSSPGCPSPHAASSARVPSALMERFVPPTAQTFGS